MLITGKPCPKCGVLYYVVPYCSKCGWYDKEFNRLSGGYLDHIRQFYESQSSEPMEAES